MFHWFKKKPNYKEGPPETWCAIKYVNGKVEPRLRMLADEWGYKSVESDINAIILHMKIRLDNHEEIV